MEKTPQQLAIWNAQALDCLQAADGQRRPLLRYATKLAGSAEQGMELYQQTLLNCHDAIQRGGYTGEDYGPYLFQALRYAHYRQDNAARRVSSLPDNYDAVQEAGPSADELHAFAEQIATDVRARFNWADRIAFRLHLDGYTFQQIADLTGGGNQS